MEFGQKIMISKEIPLKTPSFKFHAHSISLKQFLFLQRADRSRGMTDKLIMEVPYSERPPGEFVLQFT